MGFGVRRESHHTDKKKKNKTNFSNVKITRHLHESGKRRGGKSQEGRIAVSPVTCPGCCVTSTKSSQEISKGKRREKKKKEI